MQCILQTLSQQHQGLSQSKNKSAQISDCKLSFAWFVPTKIGVEGGQSGVAKSEKFRSFSTHINLKTVFPTLKQKSKCYMNLIIERSFHRYKLVYSHEKRNSKEFLKQNYVIGLDSCYLFTKKIWNMELNMILKVLMEFS